MKKITSLKYSFEIPNELIRNAIRKMKTSDEKKAITDNFQLERVAKDKCFLFVIKY